MTGSGRNTGAKRLSGKKAGRTNDSEGLHLPDDLDEQIKSKNKANGGEHQSARAAK